MKSCEEFDLHIGYITKSFFISFCLLYELLSVLAFESMDDPHIHWLQMACAIWGGKNRNVVFFRAVVSLGCAAHWSMRSKIFLFFCTHLAFQLHKKLLQSG